MLYITLSPYHFIYLELCKRDTFKVQPSLCALRKSGIRNSQTIILQHLFSTTWCRFATGHLHLLKIYSQWSIFSFAPIWTFWHFVFRFSCFQAYYCVIILFLKKWTIYLFPSKVILYAVDRALGFDSVHICNKAFRELLTLY